MKILKMVTKIMPLKSEEWKSERRELGLEHAFRAIGCRL
jgi:hypothetical protein